MNTGSSLYAFKDTKIGFMEPFVQISDSVAMRTFRATLEDENNRHLMRKYKQDIELWRLADWDEVTGDIVANKEYLIGGKDL